MRALLALLLAACASEARSSSLVERERPPSNILAEDYIGPAACGECHEKKHAGWQRGVHRTMNQRAGHELGDFDTSLTYAGQTVEFRREDGAAVMRFAGKTYRVTRTIGTRYLQEYVGQVDGGPEIRLPFAWWLRPGRWFPRAYFDSWYGQEYVDGKPAVDPFVADGETWDTRCVWCHNTFPFELRALRPGVGRGLEQFVSLEDSRRPLRERIELAVFHRLPVDDLVTVGISCESCHLGGRDHADGADISFVPVGEHLTSTLVGGREDPRIVTTICAQCHSTPSDRYPDGGATRNSSEALSMAAGACTSQLKCTSCHDPHGPPRPQAACTTCHAALAEPRLAREHSRHADVDCLDCHMPRITQGVSGLSRSHRISSPAEPAMLAAEAPHACNLCHLDRSLGWTVAELARGWNVRLDPGHADTTTPAGRLYLASPSLSTRLAAAAAYGRQRQPGPILPLLDAPVAYERMYLLFALEDALGHAVPPATYDPLAPPEVRAAQAKLLRSPP